MNLREHLDNEPRGEPLRIASAISVHPVMISQWASGTKKVPADRCPAVERATDGKVTCEELRPDITWTRIPDQWWPNGIGRPVIDPARATS